MFLRRSKLAHPQIIDSFYDNSRQQLTLISLPGVALQATTYLDITTRGCTQGYNPEICSRFYQLTNHLQINSSAKYLNKLQQFIYINQQQHIQILDSQ